VALKKGLQLSLYDSVDSVSRRPWRHLQAIFRVKGHNLNVCQNIGTVIIFG